MLEWVFRRCDGAAEARRDADRPRADGGRAQHRRASTSTRATSTSCCDVDPDEWRDEIEPIREFFAKFGDKLPAELRAQLDALEERLRAAAA